MTALSGLSAVLAMLDGARDVRRICSTCGLLERVCECSLPVVPQTTTDPAGLDSSPMTAGGDPFKSGAAAFSGLFGASAGSPLPSHDGAAGNVQQGAR